MKSVAICEACNRKIRMLTLAFKSPCCNAGWFMRHEEPKPQHEPQWEVAMRVLAGMPMPVDQSDLTIALWREDRETFGMRGFETLYPNSKTVSSLIQELIGKGLLERVAVCTYRVKQAKEKAA